MHTPSDHVDDAVLRMGMRLRAEVLTEGSERLRRLPYTVLRAVADSSYSQLVVVKQGKKYRLQVRVHTTRADSAGVEVMVKLSGGGRWRPELVRRFVKRPQPYHVIRAVLS
jgi:hypothetical protein